MRRLLQARREEIEFELEEIQEIQDELAEIERAMNEANNEGRQQKAQRTAESDAQWLRDAGRALDELIEECWGPQITERKPASERGLDTSP